MVSADDLDRRRRKVGCGVALGLCLVIGLPMLMLTGIGECPRGLPSTAACDARKHVELVFWLLGFPLLAALCGWVIYRVQDRRR